MINIIIIICLIVSIILILKLFLNNNFEKFSLDNDFDKISNLQYQNSERLANDKLLSAIDTSILSNINVNKNSLKFDKSNSHESIITDLLDTLIVADDGQHIDHKILQSNEDNNKMKRVVGGNYKKYNHELRILNNSKRVKQDYAIKVLKYKILSLMNSLKPIDKLEQIK